MVLTFKLRPADFEEHPVDLDVFEQITRSTRPWYVMGAGVSAPRRYGVCPWCDNPVQLVGMVKSGNPGQKAPHGRHLNHRQAGFEVFDPHKLRGCPYQRKGRPFSPEERDPPSVTGLKIRRIAVEHFDRLIFVLKRDTGIFFSPRLAAAMLEAWLAGEHWRYSGASLRNIAWMIAYMAPNIALKGQYLREGSPIFKALSGYLTGERQVTVRSGLGVHFQKHKIAAQDGAEARESLEMVVSDFSSTNYAPEAPVVFQQTLVLDHPRFLALLSVRQDHPARDEGLLDIASQLGRRFPAPVLEADDE